MRIKAKLAAGALLAAALIAGCTPQGGTAAVINGEPLFVAEVDDGMAIRAFLNPQPNSPPPGPQDILQMLIEGRVAIDVASTYGLSVSANEAATLLDSLGGEDMKVDGEYPEALLDIVRAIRVAEALRTSPNEDQIVAEMTAFRNEASVEINPRYGTWDPAQGGLVSNVPEWIKSVG